MAQTTETASAVTRRTFIAGSTGLGFALAWGGTGLFLLPEAAARTGGAEIGAWVRIAPDDRITILTPAAEMGQGSMTGVPVVLAEELDADWDKVTLEWAPADAAVYGYGKTSGGGTGQAMAIVGSRAVMLYYDDMRIAGAQVRKVLLQAVAKKWGVDRAELSTGPSVVIHKPTGRRMSYGEIAGFAEAPKTMPAVSKDELKKSGEFRLIGKPVGRHDIPAKVDGSAKYSIDIHLPGMVYASTVHAPVQGAAPQSWNDAEIRALPGFVGAVKLDKGVAVIADSFEHVMGARGALQVDWATGAEAEGYDSETALHEGYAAVAADKAALSQTVESLGDAESAFAAAGKVYRAEFRSDYGYHAQMEPLNAVARFDRATGTVEIWEGTQAPDWSVRAIAKGLGMPPERIVHHQQYMGGGFGRRTVPDYTIEAAQVSREIGKPVKMIWTREEDLAFGMFRPQSFQCVEAALDGQGRVAGWRHCVVGDGGNLLSSGIKLDRYYAIPNRHVEQRVVPHGIRLKHWRAVAHPFNVFAIEGLVDEMAAKEGLDPLRFRRERMPLTAKAKAVFDAVETMSEWGARRPDGRALGLSVTERSGSLGAGVVEISLDPQRGKIHVHKVWVAVDAGTVVQPGMARRNVESGVIYGLSSVLKERATIRGGAVEQSNFHDYEVLRMAEAPEEIAVEFLARDAKPTGIGEIGNPFVGAAVANAFHALTGKRLYHMPFTPERVLKALEA